MSHEREDFAERKKLSEARILMISRFGSGKVGGIPSVLISLEKVWKEYTKEVLNINPENQSRVNLCDNWDLVIFHHSSMFGVRKFLELPERLKEKSNFIWYQAVDEETLKRFGRLGVGNTHIVPLAMRVGLEIVSRKFLANYQGVINYAISNNVRDSLLKANIGSGKEIHVVEVPSLFPESRDKVNDFEERGDGKFVVLTVSRISPEKGIENVIETYKKLFRLAQNSSHIKIARPIKFVVAGEHINNSYYETIMKQVRQLPSDDNFQIEFVGKKNDREVLKLYQNSHLFLMPGIYDSWGLVTMEAISYGLPVVGFKAPGTKEIFDKSQSRIGSLVGSSEMAAESIVDIMSNVNLWEELSNGALQESGRHNSKQVSLNLLNEFWNNRYQVSNEK